MTFSVTTVAETKAVLEYFNGFHGGFIDRQGAKPAGQLITATFNEATGFNADFGGLLHEWSIYEFLMSDARRTLEDERPEPCLQAALLQSRLSGQTWRHNEDLSFSFARAEFAELDP